MNKEAKKELKKNLLTIAITCFALHVIYAFLGLHFNDIQEHCINGRNDENISKSVTNFEGTLDNTDVNFTTLKSSEHFILQETNCDSKNQETNGGEKTSWNPLISELNHEFRIFIPQCYRGGDCASCDKTKYRIKYTFHKTSDYFLMFSDRQNIRGFSFGEVAL